MQILLRLTIFSIMYPRVFHIQKFLFKRTIRTPNLKCKHLFLVVKRMLLSFQIQHEFKNYVSLCYVI